MSMAVKPGKSLLYHAIAKMRGDKLITTSMTTEEFMRMFKQTAWEHDLHAEMVRGPFGITEPVDVTARRLLRNEVPDEDRRIVLGTVVRRDLYMATRGAFADEMLDDNIYRVSLFSDGVDVLCLGLESVDSPIGGHYDSPDALPRWVQERLAVLMMTTATPPTVEVVGVGRRVSSHVYWVYAPDRPTGDPSACGSCV